MPRHEDITVLSSVSFIVGCLLGLLLTILLYLVVSIGVHPWLTMAARKLRGDSVPTQTPLGHKVDDAWALVLSDLHVDTWDDNLIHQRSTALADILTTAHGNTRRLIINGDLLDLPPHPNNQKDPDLLTIPHNWPDGEMESAENLVAPGQPLRPGSLQGRYASILMGLFNPTGMHKIGLIGNHDLGISGLRFVAMAGKSVNWAPGLLIEDGKGGYIYIEHGHRHDPLLWIYTVYALIDILRGDTQETGGARGGRVGKAGDAAIRTLAPVARQVKSYDTGDPKAELSWGQKLTLCAFRAAAYRRLQELRSCEFPISAILMGHTHLPDRFQLDEKTLYVNIGDWAGNTKHQTYAVINHEGEVLGPYQWS